jgi:predicted dinucleotide-binding enzyme
MSIKNDAPPPPARILVIGAGALGARWLERGHDVRYGVRDVGLSAVDAGPLSAARLLEPLAMLWIELAMQRGHGREFPFSLVGRARS